MTVAKKRHRSFSPKVEGEPITFDLYGQTFTARPEIPGALILDFASSGGNEGASNVSAITDFFKSTLLADDFVRFDKLIHDPETLVTLTTLTDIIEFLVEEYSDGRPLEASEQS